MYKEQAIGECLLWWIREEFLFHQNFRKIEFFFEENKVQLCADHVISIFLRRYSIRRTIKGNKDYDYVELFTRELLSTKFLETIKEKRISEIDNFSNRFQSKSKDSIKSALSKFATLYDPSEYVMYDSRSRKGMYRLKNVLEAKLDYRITYGKIDKYENYVSYAKELSKEIDENQLLDVLKKIGDFASIKYLRENLLSFKLRIVDKWLWLEGYHTVKPRNYSIDDYVRIIKYES